MQKTGIITEDLFLVSDADDSYKNFGIVNINELKSIYKIAAKKGDLVTWNAILYGWATKDYVSIPEKFVKENLDIIGIVTDKIFQFCPGTSHYITSNQQELNDYQIADIGDKVIWSLADKKWRLLNNTDKIIPEKFVKLI